MLTMLGKNYLHLRTPYNNTCSKRYIATLASAQSYPDFYSSISAVSFKY